VLILSEIDKRVARIKRHKRVRKNISGRKEKEKYQGNIKAAKVLGSLLAKKLEEKGIKKVVFDRGGYLYHGRVKAVAESARKGKIVF